MDESNSLAAWLKTYQAYDNPGPIADPSRATAGLSPIVQDNLDKLTFETEPAAFEGLLHDLAPKELKGE